MSNINAWENRKKMNECVGLKTLINPIRNNQEVRWENGFKWIYGKLVKCLFIAVLLKINTIILGYIENHLNSDTFFK